MVDPGLRPGLVGNGSFGRKGKLEGEGRGAGALRGGRAECEGGRWRYWRNGRGGLHPRSRTS